METVGQFKARYRIDFPRSLPEKDIDAYFLHLCNALECDVEYSHKTDSYLDFKDGAARLSGRELLIEGLIGDRQDINMPFKLVSEPEYDATLDGYKTIYPALGKGVGGSIEHDEFWDKVRQHSLEYFALDFE